MKAVRGGASKVKSKKEKVMHPPRQRSTALAYSEIYAGIGNESSARLRIKGKK
ncbi:MAG: hypothetical protein FWG99_06200 [Treponema sp.]|nr:hypothetical protein [Treponema sp.]